MERLTARSVKNNMAYLVKVKPDEQEVESPYPNTLNAIIESFQRLAEYENKIERGELVEVVKCHNCMYADLTRVKNGDIGCAKVEPMHYCAKGKRGAENAT